MQALEGIKILDFCRNAPGMFCTMILGDLGADILMVERPIYFGQRGGDRAAYERVVSGIANLEEERSHATYNALQRNKRSLGLNLKERSTYSIPW